MNQEIKKNYEMTEINYSNIEDYCEKLCQTVRNDYDYDLVIFIAKGSYIIGKKLAEKNHCDFIEIFSTRSGGKLKKIIKPFLKMIPKRIAIKLREKEFNSNIHEKKSDRSISYDEKLWSKYINSKKILLVDDSVDTGYSVLYSLTAIKEYFKDSKIRVAAINCFTKSKKIVKTDYYLLEDHLLKGPWSSDSKDNKKYIEEYYKWHNALKEEL